MTTLPIVHLGGTSRAELTRQHRNAYDAMRAAVRAVQDAEPNARDYYPVPGSFQIAGAEHQSRLDRLRGMMAEIDDILSAVELP